MPELDLSRIDLVQENLTLKTQVAAVTAEQDLVAKTIRIIGFQVQYKRLPSADAKIEIIAAIKAAAEIISLQNCLSAIGLTDWVAGWDTSFYPMYYRQFFSLCPRLESKSGLWRTSHKRTFI